MTFQGTTTGVVTSVPETKPLTASDRCDRCGAQAYASVVMPNTDTPLLFCGHHFTRYERTFHRVALVIRDERCRLHTSG